MNIKLKNGWATVWSVLYTATHARDVCTTISHAMWYGSAWHMQNRCVGTELIQSTFDGVLGVVQVAHGRGWFAHSHVGSCRCR